jgi:hypothetical protein
MNIGKDISVGFYDHLSLYISPHVCEDRRTCVSEVAYFKAEHRGFAPGHELEDWLSAENEVDQRLCGEGRAY